MFDFAIYDVFAEKPFSGCPAAVVRAHQAQPLSVLSVLAQEFNLPETCLYWWKDGSVMMQFATAAGPIAACGHGLLSVLADAALTTACGSEGELLYRIGDSAPSIAKYRQESPRTFSIRARWNNFPEIGPSLPVRETAMLLGLPEECLCRDLPMKAVNSGILNGLVPIVDVKTLLEIQPTFGQDWTEYFNKHRLADLHLYVIQNHGCTEPTTLYLRTRNVFPYGVREEAATGTASVSLAAALKQTVYPDGLQFSFIQGVQRLGNLQVFVSVAPSGRLDLWLEGTVVLIARGNDLALPSVSSE
jgi:PhzF family phenazine biosynthesis protein